jgi:hypothetical protein
MLGREAFEKRPGQLRLSIPGIVHALRNRIGGVMK